MHLSFHFQDFFRNKSASTSDLTDVKTPTFLVHSGVVGDLKIKDLKESLISDENARIELDLEGFMRTELDTYVNNTPIQSGPCGTSQSHPEFRVTVEKKVLSMTQALPIQGHATDVLRNERRYPFRFNVQSWVWRDEASSRHNRALASRGNYASIPPSLWHEISTTPQGVPKPRAGARVTYKLTARLLKDHHTVDRLVQPILLFVSQPPSPPMCVADFTGEYRPVSKSVLRGPLFRRAGEISVIVQEPKQLTVRADRPDSIVELPVKMLLERSNGDTALPDCPTVEAEIKWNFRFSTFVSIFEQQGPPTLKEALVSPATAFVRSSLGSRSLRMVWRNWRAVGGERDSSRIESEQSLWLTLPRSQVLTPTFWSPFLSRRYSISLQLKVTKPGTAKLEVEVPIQVGIDAAMVDGGDGSSRIDALGTAGSIFDDADGDELLPQYQR